MRYRNKYNNQPREEEGKGTDERWGGDGAGADGDWEQSKIAIDHNVNNELY